MALENAACIPEIVYLALQMINLVGTLSVNCNWLLGKDVYPDHRVSTV